MVLVNILHHGARVNHLCDAGPQPRIREHPLLRVQMQVGAAGDRNKIGFHTIAQPRHLRNGNALGKRHLTGLDRPSPSRTILAERSGHPIKLRFTTPIVGKRFGLHLIIGCRSHLKRAGAGTHKRRIIPLVGGLGQDHRARIGETLRQNRIILIRSDLHLQVAFLRHG